MPKRRRNRKKISRQQERDFQTSKANKGLFLGWNERLAELAQKKGIKLNVKTSKRDPLRKGEQKQRLEVQKGSVLPVAAQGEPLHLKIQRDRRRFEMEICKQRKARRESLFAAGAVGNGVKGPKVKKILPKSNVRC